MHRNDESQRASGSTDRLTQESQRVSDCPDLHRDHSRFQTALINIGFTDGQIVLTNTGITVLFQTVLTNINHRGFQTVLTYIEITEGIILS